MDFRETIAAYSETHVKHVNTLWVKFRVSLMLKQMVGIVTTVL
jgi:hypothetical protein